MRVGGVMAPSEAADSQPLEERNSDIPGRLNEEMVLFSAYMDTMLNQAGCRIPREEPKVPCVANHGHASNEH